MAKNGLMKVVTRVVLMSYITQLLAPIVHACEVESDSSSFGARSDMRDSSPPLERMLQKDLVKGLKSTQPVTGWQSIALPSSSLKETADQLLNQFQQSPSDKTPSLTQAENYQYRLSVKTLGSSQQKQQLKLSRRIKGSTDRFEKLHTTTLFKGKLNVSSEAVQDDSLLQLFKATSVGQYIDGGVAKCYAWQIPGFGTINIGIDGSISINQDEQAPILLSYDLVLKTSNDLFIQSLQVAALSLTSPKKKQQGHTTRILRNVSANNFYTDHDVRNLGRMDIDHQIYGPGKLTNHGIVKLEGTAHDYAIFNIHAFENKKLDGYLDPIVEASHLCIKGENHRFMNGEHCEFKISDSFVVDASNGSALLNKGKMTLNKATLNRETINLGNWQAKCMLINGKLFTNQMNGDLKFTDYLEIHSPLLVDLNTYLLNMGDMDIKKFSLKKGKVVNATGALMKIGEEFKGSGSLQNDGNITSKGCFKHIGKFVNAGVWDHQGNVECSPVNRGKMVWRNGTWIIKADSFDNSGDWLLDHMTCTNPISIYNYHSLEVKNSTVVLSRLFNRGRKFINSTGSSIDVKEIQSERGTFFNEGEMNVTKSLFVKNGENKGKIKGADLLIDTSESFQNEGEIQLNTITGKGVFYNRGLLSFSTQNQKHGLINVKNFHNGGEGKFPAKIIGDHVGVSSGNEGSNNNETFSNEGDIVVNTFEIHGWDGLSYGKPATLFSNRGYIESKALHVYSPRSLHDKYNWENEGVIKTGKTHLVGFSQNFSNKPTGLFESTTFICHTDAPFSIRNAGILKIGTNESSVGDLETTLHNLFKFDNLATGTFEINNLVAPQLFMSNHEKIMINGRLNVPCFVNAKGSSLIWDYRNPYKDNEHPKIIRKFVNEAGAYANIKSGIGTDAAIIQNDGDMESAGNLCISEGEFTNTGTWKHKGDIEFGKIKFSNKGTMSWQQGKWSFSPTNSTNHPNAFENHGNWFLDQISCTQPLSIHNYGTIKFANNYLTFTSLVNHQDLIFSSGQYVMLNTFQNNHLMSFQDNDWVFTDDESHTALNRLLLKDLGISGFFSTGEIESSHTLTYDVKTMPKAIKAAGNLDITKRHQSHRTLEDLLKVHSNAKVTFYCPGVTTTKDYEFGTLNHLELFIDGIFKTIHSIKAPSLTLDVNGPLTCGESNDKKGTIAATFEYKPVLLSEFHTDKTLMNGKIYCDKNNNNLKCKMLRHDGKDVEVVLPIIIADVLTQDILNNLQSTILEELRNRGHELDSKGTLTIKAHSIDGRFGIMSSTGPTTLTSTGEDVLLGSNVRGIGYIDPKVVYFPGANITDYTMNIGNGSFLTSSGPLNIVSARDIIFRYGDIYCDDKTLLKAVRDITNHAGKIRSTKPVRIEAINYWHKRDPYEYKRNWLYFDHQGYTNGYSDQYMEFPGSRPACVESTGDIEFYVQHLYNLASDFSSGGKILINGVDVQTKVPGYVEESINVSQKAMRWPWGYWEYHVAQTIRPNILFAKKFEMNIGQFTIKATMYGPLIVIHSTGTEDNFLLSSGNTVSKPTQTQLVDLYEYITSKSDNPWLSKKDKEGTLVPVVPMGRSAVFPHGGIVQLEASQLASQFECVINPLSRIPLGLCNLFIQEILGSYTGKNYVQGAKGEQLFSSLWNYNRQYYKGSGKDIVTRDTLNDIQHAMLIHQLQLIDNKPLQLTFLAIPPHEFTDQDGIRADEIDIQTKGNLTIEDSKIVGKKWVNIFSEEQLKVLSTKHIHTLHNGFQEYVNPSIVKCDEGPLTAIGKKGFTMTAAKLRSLLRLMAGSTEGNTVIEDVLLKREERHRHVEKGGMFEGDTVVETTQTSHTSESSELSSKVQDVHVLSGKDHKTMITGSLLQAAAKIIFEGDEVETHASAGINTSTTRTTKEGPFSSSESNSMSQSATLSPSSMNAGEVHINTKKAKFYGTDFIADVIYDKTEDGASFGPTTTWLEYFQQTISESSFLTSDVGIKGGYETMYPCHMMVNKIIRDIDHGEIKFESVDWDKNRTEIIGKLAETTYQLKSYQTSWAKVDQLIPDEALVVVALGVAIATQGYGVKFLYPMLNSITATTGLQLSTAGVAAVNAGFSAICSQLVTSTLTTGNPIQGIKSTFSPQGLKSIGISMASAGLCSKLGSVWKIDMNPSLKEVLNPGTKPVFTDFLKSQALKCGVDAGLQVTVGGAKPSVAIASALKQAPIAAAAAWASYNIGDLGFTGQLTPEQQDALHTVLGGAYGAALNPDKPLEGALSGAANAFVAARASKMMFGTPQEVVDQAKAKLHEEGRPLTKENIELAASDILHTKTAISTIIAASATAAIARDAALTSTGIATAMNVTENNCVPSMTKSLMVAQASATEPEEFWQDEFDDPRDVYLTIAHAIENGRRDLAGESTFERQLDEQIESITKTLSDPTVSKLKKASYALNLQKLWEIKSQMEGAKVAITWAQKDVKTFKTIKDKLEDGLQTLMNHVSKNLDNPTLSGWRQAVSMVNMLAIYNMGQATSFIPVTNGEVVLVGAPWFKTSQAARILHAIHPARFLSLAARMERASVVPIQEMKLLPAPKLDLAASASTSKKVHEHWNLGPTLRGEKIEQALGQNLPQNFPTIDKFSYDNGIAVSIKSIDLNARTYQNTSTLSSKLKQYIDTVSEFKGKTSGQNFHINSSQIKGRALDLAIPNKGTSEQWAVIEQIIDYGQSKGVKVTPIIH